MTRAQTMLPEFDQEMAVTRRVLERVLDDKGEYKPDPNKSLEWNRGAYLVEGPGHCGACHTPKNSLGGDKTSEFLHGGLLQGWFAPNITNDEAKGLGKWSVDDIVAYLKTGHNRITAATGIMAEEIEHASSKMTECATLFGRSVIRPVARAAGRVELRLEK